MTSYFIYSLVDCNYCFFSFAFFYALLELKSHFIFVGLQIPTASSQQMDDLFDILIESGGTFVILLQTTIDHITFICQLKL